MSQQSALGSVYLFKDLTPQELQSVASIAQERNLTAGEEAFMTGEVAKSFFVIVMGSIKIFSNSSQGDSLGIATLGSGSHFGEVPFFDQGKRSATAQAIESSRMLEVSYTELTALLESNPSLALKVYKNCSRFLATRLRNTLGDLTQAKEAKTKHF